MNKQPMREHNYIRGVAFFCECGNHAWGALDKGLTTMVSPEDSSWLLHKMHGARIVGKDHVDAYAAFSSPIKHLYQFAPNKGPAHLHRAIMQAPPDIWIDHRSRDKLDNRRTNLRRATQAQNSRNTRRGDNRSGYRGVGFNRSKSRYHAGITFDGKYHYVGTFNTSFAAAIARDRAAIDLHGAFASLNYPADPHERRRIILDEIDIITARITALKEEIAEIDAALTIELVAVTK